MNVLVTLNSTYIYPLKVMLKSLFLNNQEDYFDIYIMHSRLKKEEILDIEEFVQKHGSKVIEIKIEEEHFANAPLILNYPKEMYYRLLAFRFLPNLDRILYLDPDILVINSVRELYQLDMDGYLYAAANRNSLSTTTVNKIRLKPYNIECYYNSGVLLMNLELQRKYIIEQEIYDFVKKYQWKLVLPDQDIINALYAKLIKSLDEMVYNYDVRKYKSYKYSSKGACNMDYVINQTVFLHFCGKKKPWKSNYQGYFHALYKHYEKLTFHQTPIVS
ncbi:MAG TPA: glycosyltransferase family 8 protein [Haloplasmataceae bacterium]